MKDMLTNFFTELLWIVGAVLLWFSIVVRFICLWVFTYRKIIILRRFYKNLQRNILIVTPDNSSEYNMSREKKLLDNNLFWKIESVDSYDDVSELWDYSLIILWYDEEKESCKDLIIQIKASNTNIPVIIYTYNKKLWDYTFINSYIYHTFANTPVSLLNTAYWVMSIYDNKVLWKQ